MSYLVLARKYRPQNFEQMVGQEHVVQALSNALSQQRLHHAYLFTGTRGVGKTTVSRILAKSLNCQGADGKGSITAHPCGVCQACQDIDAGRFVDYTELDAASNRGVEEVQSLMEQAVYKPVQGRFKVFMIDEVHMLSNTAFNAMLKTLEEPPEYLKFVLATTDPQKVPVTVLSRCLQFNLRPMAPPTIVEHLEKVLGSEDVAHDRSSLQLLARGARGSMRDALSLADQAIAYGNGSLQEATVRQMLGAVDKRYVFKVIAALAVGDGKQVLELTNTLRREGIAAASLLEDMAVALQQMALLQSVPDAELDTLDDADGAHIQQLAAQLPADETQLLYSFCLKGREELGLAPDEYSGLVMVLLRLLAFQAPMDSNAQSAPNAPAAAGGLADGDASDIPTTATATASAHVAAGAPSVALPSAAAVTVQSLETPSRMPKPGLREEGVAAAEVLTPALRPGAEVTHQARPDVAASGEGLEPALAAAPLPAEHRDAPPLPWENAPEQTRAEVPAQAPGEVPAHQRAQSVDAAASSAAEAHSTACEALPQSSAGVGLAATLDGGAGETLAQQWLALVQQLSEAGLLLAVVRELAMQAQLVKRDETGVWLRVANQTLMNESLRLKLQSVLAGAGVAGTVTLENGVAAGTPAQLLQAKAEQVERIAQSIVENDARVQWLKANLGAEIVPGSIKPLSVAPRA